MGRIIALTGLKHNGQIFGSYGTPAPRVIYVQEDSITVHAPGGTGKPTKVTQRLGGEVNVYSVYEKLMQVEAMRNPASADLLVKQHLATGLVGAGTTQGAGTVLTKYFNETTTIGAAATEAFVLPAATVGKVVVVVNNDASGDAAQIFPASGEFINALTVNSKLAVAAGDRVHFVCPTTAGKWVTAIDRGK